MPEVTITIKQTGPYVIEGEINLVDHVGQLVPTTPGKRISLCRCGASTTKPFCDGTHSKIGFLAAEKAQQGFDQNKAP
ncbi:MAG: CDGSH iron-sulfur domain-containing protein [Gemmatimonadaceae bacterium]|nr:CDGSH iron-sulfur domain-containing protein [Gemmatimonadaceae bacterium]